MHAYSLNGTFVFIIIANFLDLRITDIACGKNLSHCHTHEN